MSAGFTIDITIFEQYFTFYVVALLPETARINMYVSVESIKCRNNLQLVHLHAQNMEHTLLVFYCYEMSGVFESTLGIVCVV